MFYLLSILFIFKNLFYLYNKESLDTRFYQKDIRSMSFLPFFYYLLSFFYPIWIVFGIFTDYQNIFYILLLINVLKFPLYHLSNIFYNKYLKINPIISIVTLLILLYAKFL
jgi:hypothetical protein